MPAGIGYGKKSKAILGRAFSEVFSNTPKAVKHTARKFGKKRAEKQRVAIAMSKARKRGARIPRR